MSSYFHTSTVAARVAWGGLLVGLAVRLALAPTAAKADTFPFAGFEWQAYDVTPYPSPYHYEPRPADVIGHSETEVAIKTPDQYIYRGIKTVAEFPKSPVVFTIEMWQTESFNWQSFPFLSIMPFAILGYFNWDRLWYFATATPTGSSIQHTYALTPGGPQLGVHYFAKCEYDPGLSNLVFSFRAAGAAYQEIYSGPADWGLTGLETRCETGKVAKVFLETEDGTGTVHYRFTCAGCNVPPVAKCKAVTVGAGAGCTATASIDDGSFDPNGDSITVTQTPPGPYPLGTNSVTLTVTDSQGASNQCTATVTVVDVTPPVLSNLSAQPNVLWPPNNKLVLVVVTAHASDNCGVASCKIIAVACNEGAASDWQITGDLTVQLRATRAGNGSGRIYTITVECKDKSGNATTGTVAVAVPHDSSP